jgi:hypothetical protein
MVESLRASFQRMRTATPNLITLQALDAVMDRERGEPLEVIAGTRSRPFLIAALEGEQKGFVEEAIVNRFKTTKSAASKSG